MVQINFNNVLSRGVFPIQTLVIIINGTRNFGISPFYILGQMQPFLKFFRKPFGQSSILIGIGIGPIIKVN